MEQKVGPRFARPNFLFNRVEFLGFCKVWSEKGPIFFYFRVILFPFQSIVQFEKNCNSTCLYASGRSSTHSARALPRPPRLRNDEYAGSKPPQIQSCDLTRFFPRLCFRQKTCFSRPPRPGNPPGT